MDSNSTSYFGRYLEGDAAPGTIVYDQHPQRSLLLRDFEIRSFEFGKGF